MLAPASRALEKNFKNPLRPRSLPLAVLIQSALLRRRAGALLPLYPIENRSKPEKFQKRRRHRHRRDAAGDTPLSHGNGRGLRSNWRSNPGFALERTMDEDDGNLSPSRSQ